MFRLTKDRSVINRYGFNSEGHQSASDRLRARIRSFLSSYSCSNAQYVFDPVERETYGLAVPLGIPKSLTPGRLLGVNLGKNKISPADSNEDYVEGVKNLGPFADYIVINVSSPNTPGLRALQRREPMELLLKEVISLNLLNQSLY